MDPTISPPPLVFKYAGTPEITAQITVTGSGLSTAALLVLFGTTQMWTTTLAPENPTATLPRLALGSVTLDAGATVTLTTLPALGRANVGRAIVLANPGTPVTSGTVVAEWNPW